jgi:hypothetical protein
LDESADDGAESDFLQDGRVTDRYTDPESAEITNYFLSTARILAANEPECLAKRMMHDEACVSDVQQALLEISRWCSRMGIELILQREAA